MALTALTPLTLTSDPDHWRDVAVLSRHRSRPVLPRRHHRPGHRADRRGQGRVRPVRGQGPVPRVRPHHQPGLRRLGRHLRGGAPQAPPPVDGRQAPRLGLSRPIPHRPPRPRRRRRPALPASRLGRPLRVRALGRERRPERHPEVAPWCRADRRGPPPWTRSMVPSSSVVTRVRTIDRPRPGAVLEGEALRETDAVVGDPDPQLGAVVVELEQHVTGADVGRRPGRRGRRRSGAAR